MKIMLTASQTDELLHFINSLNNLDRPDRIIEAEESITISVLIEFRLIDSGRKRISIINIKHKLDPELAAIESIDQKSAVADSENKINIKQESEVKPDSEVRQLYEVRPDSETKKES